FGKKKKYYKKIEDKVVIPLSIGLIVLFLIIFFFINDIILDLNSSRVLIGLDVFLLYIFGIWGLFLYQKTPRGKILALWFLIIPFIWLAAYIVDLFISHQYWSGRILLLPATVAVIGFLAYLYKLIKTKEINTLKMKLFIILLISFSIFSHFYDELVNIDDIEYSLMRREVYSIQWSSNYMTDKNIIFAEFGMSYVFMFYDYPFNETDIPFNGYRIHYFLDIVNDFFDPDNHFDANGVNQLQALKDYYDMDFFIILDDNYLSMIGFETYRRLTEDEMEQYFNMEYLNKICSSTSEYGVEVPYYWVI
ncbi:MAG: hypothetical protein ACFFAT_16055, partial [Promethearchaeota archaeon]